MKRLIAVLALVLGLTFDSAIAVPRISPEQDFQCAVDVYGLRVEPELDIKVEKEVKRITTLADHLYQRKFNVVWGYGIWAQPTTAGVTLPSFGISFFNPIYLNKYKEEFIRTVIRHEIAHTITYEVYGIIKNDHGREWQSVMRALGDSNPQTYHSYTFCSEYGVIKLPVGPGI